MASVNCLPVEVLHMILNLASDPYSSGRHRYYELRQVNQLWCDITFDLQWNTHDMQWCKTTFSWRKKLSRWRWRRDTRLDMGLEFL